MQQCKSSKTIGKLLFSPANKETTVYPQLVQDIVQFPSKPCGTKTDLIRLLYLHLRQGELSGGFANVAAKQWLSLQHWIDWQVSYFRYCRCKPLIVLNLRVKAYPQTCKPQNRGMTLYDCLRRGAYNCHSQTGFPIHLNHAFSPYKYQTWYNIDIWLSTWDSKWSNCINTPDTAASASLSGWNVLPAASRYLCKAERTGSSSRPWSVEVHP